MAVCYICYTCATFGHMDTCTVYSSGSSSNSWTKAVGTYEFDIPTTLVASATASDIKILGNPWGSFSTGCTWTHTFSVQLLKGNTSLYSVSINLGNSTANIDQNVTVSPGDHLTLKITTNIKGQIKQSAGTYTGSYGVSNLRVQFGAVIPEAEELITADKVNEFSTFFQLTNNDVPQGDLISRNAWQTISDELSKMKTTFNGNTSATVVNMDATKPMLSDLQEIITQMTDKYLTRTVSANT